MLSKLGFHIWLPASSLTNRSSNLWLIRTHLNSVPAHHLRSMKSSFSFDGSSSAVFNPRRLLTKCWPTWQDVVWTSPYSGHCSTSLTKTSLDYTNGSGLTYNYPSIRTFIRLLGMSFRLKNLCLSKIASSTRQTKSLSSKSKSELFNSTSCFNRWPASCISLTNWS